MVEGAASAFGVVLPWLFIGLIGAVPTILLLRWWSEGVLNGGEAIGLLAIYALAFAAMMGPAPPQSKILLGIVLAAISGWLLYMATLGQKRSSVDFEREQEEVFRSAITANPGNVAARCELARNLHRQRRMSEAIEELERAVRLSPATTVEERITLDGWRRELDRRPGATMNCRWCHEETPADREVCMHCGQPTSAVREVVDAVMSDIPGMVRQVLIVMLILIVLAFLLSALQSFAANILMLILVTAALWWLWSRL